MSSIVLVSVVTEVLSPGQSAVTVTDLSRQLLCLCSLSPQLPVSPKSCCAESSAP